MCLTNRIFDDNFLFRCCPVFLLKYYLNLEGRMSQSLITGNFHCKNTLFCQSFTAEVEVEISGRGSSLKHIRQSNWVCFRLFVNLYILKTNSIWLSNMFYENILDSQIEYVFETNILNLTVEYVFFANLRKKSQPQPQIKQKHEICCSQNLQLTRKCIMCLTNRILDDIFFVPMLSSFPVKILYESGRHLDKMSQNLITGNFHCKNTLFS